ncbi:MAG: hypothetical protein WDN72_06780 [Alphaproteobacteria bacterium]
MNKDIKPVAGKETIATLDSGVDYRLHESFGGSAQTRPFSPATQHALQLIKEFLGEDAHRVTPYFLLDGQQLALRRLKLDYQVQDKFKELLKGTGVDGEPISLVTGLNVTNAIVDRLASQRQAEPESATVGPKEWAQSVGPLNVRKRKPLTTTQEESLLR